MREKRQARFRHSLPKPSKARIGKIDVLTIRQTFHQHGASLEAALQFVERIASGRVNRNARKKFRMSFRQTQHDIVRHKHGTEILSRSSIGIVHPLMREKDHRIHRRFANELSEMLGVDGFEIAFERTGRNSELAQHETGEPAMPSFQPQPAAGTSDAIPHHMHMRVDSSDAEIVGNGPHICRASM